MKNYIDKADIEARIKDVNYLVMPDGRTTICTILMVNGFTVNGFSACVDIKKFDAALGRKYAYENAFLDLWQLEGYLLAERLHKHREATPTAIVAATHICRECGALWKKWDDGSWNLRSEKCGPCCDNAVMGGQIERLPDFTS